MTALRLGTDSLGGAREFSCDTRLNPGAPKERETILAPVANGVVFTFVRTPQGWTAYKGRAKAVVQISPPDTKAISEPSGDKAGSEK